MRLGLLGCGTIGGEVVNAVIQGKLPRMKLVAVCDINRTNWIDSACSILGAVYIKNPTILYKKAEVVLEAANPEVLKTYAIPLLNKGVDLIAMSVGAFADTSFYRKVYEYALKAGRRVASPSGAIGGLDIIRAAQSTGQLSSVLLSTIKNPRSLVGAPFFEGRKIDLKNLRKKTLLFDGSAAEAILGFPQNVNVAVAIGLAGLGPERTNVRIYADPKTTRTIHQIKAQGSFGELNLELKNFPSPQNPRTSYLAILSAIATLQQWTEPFRIG